MGKSLRAILALLASALLASPLVAQAPQDRAALRAEIDQTRKKIEDLEKGTSFEHYGEPESLVALGRFWTLLQQWTSKYLNAHPQATAREIEKDLNTLVNKEDLASSAARLSDDAVAVSLQWDFRGDVFVLSRTPPQPFAVTWTLRAQAAKSPPDERLSPWLGTEPLIHAGPLAGRVLPLPPSRSGRPRFLIIAIQQSGMGLDVPGQLSVWEWTGSEAVPQFIQDYSTTGDGARIEGDRLLVSTKEDLKRFFSCGSCDDPADTWTLRITPDGLTDLGRAFHEPLLHFVDDLLDRTIRGQDTSAMASHSARARLAKIIDAERPEGSQGDDIRFGLIGGLKVRARGNHRVIDLQSDELHILLTVERRHGKPYVTAVKDVNAQSAPFPP
jgi:hypothetical protein